MKENQSISISFSKAKKFLINIDINHEENGQKKKGFFQNL